MHARKSLNRLYRKGTIMHPNQAIQEQGHKPVTAEKALATGRIQKAAASIFGGFAKGAGNERTRLVYGIVSEGFTPEEYENIEREAVNMAGIADQAAGFKMPQGAKGPEKYGPKQRTMRARVSERKAVFGVMRLNLSAIVSTPKDGVLNLDTLPPFDTALALAKQYMRKESIDWKGQSSNDRRQLKDANTVQGLEAKAKAKVEETEPRQQGETLTQWNIRTGEKQEAVFAELLVEANQKKAIKIAKTLMDDHGPTLCALIADRIDVLLAAINTGEPEPDDDTQANDGGTQEAPDEQTQAEAKLLTQE